MTDHIDHAGESPGPDRAPGRGGRHWFAWTVLMALLAAGCLAGGLLVLLILVYIGRPRQEPA
ncbi:MAG TPA: hypothetical protein VEO01_03435 [Pseudonocardiaceae bacterium]|nr:hypothetical protein [Pseudonocardiaceae bacterium]